VSKAGGDRNFREIEGLCPAVLPAESSGRKEL